MKNLIIILCAAVFILTSCEQGPYKRAIEYNKTGTNFALKGKNDSALIYFEKAIESDSTYLLALQNKINILAKEKRFTQAIADLNQMIVQKPIAETFQLKGILLDKTNEPQEAKKFYQLTIKSLEQRLSKATKDDAIQIQTALGLNYFLLGDTSLAKTILLKDKDQAKDLGLRDTILNNLDNKKKIIDYLSQ